MWERTVNGFKPMTGQIVPPDGLDRRAASGPIVVGDAIHISLRKGDPRLSLIGSDASGKQLDA